MYTHWLFARNTVYLRPSAHYCLTWPVVTQLVKAIGRCHIYCISAFITASIASDMYISNALALSAGHMYSPTKSRPLYVGWYWLVLYTDFGSHSVPTIQPMTYWKRSEMDERMQRREGETDWNRQTETYRRMERNRETKTKQRRESGDMEPRATRRIARRQADISTPRPSVKKKHNLLCIVKTLIAHRLMGHRSCHNPINTIWHYAWTQLTTQQTRTTDILTGC